MAKKNEKKEVDDKKTEASQKVIIEEEESVKRIDVQEIKNSLNDYMRYRIDKEISEAIEKANKKIIHYKNRIIIKRDIVIVILLVICFFLGFNLYNLSSIKIDITTNKKNVIVNKKVKKKEKKEEVVTEKNLEEKIKEYGSLIDDIFINNDSDYYEDFYNGNISLEAKLYLSMNRINSEKVVFEDDSLYVDDDDLKESYESIFDDEYEPSSFKYGDYNFKYLKSKKLYLSDGEFDKVKSNFVRDIIQVDEEDDGISIVTVEGLLKKNKLYDSDLKEIKNYDGGDLKKFEKSLNKYVYKFVKKDDVYKFVSIKKK